MSDDSVDKQKEESPGLKGPGSHLREAREARNLTVMQVAAQLRMQVRVIEAIENDDYNSLPSSGSTFIRGYLRSYSRLLGLNEESILALMQSGGTKEPSLVGSIYDGKDEVSSSDFSIRMVSTLILIGVVVGVGWWVSQRMPTIEMDVVDAEQSASEQGLSIPTETLQLSDDEPLPGETIQVGDVDGAGVADTSELSNSETTTETLSDSPESAIEEEQDVVEPVEPEPPVENTPTAAHSIEPPPLTAGMPQSMIELEYQEDCWTEVTDAAGRKLTYTLIPAGQKITLHGEAPFKVFLGYATGVTIYYNGDLYDHSPFQRGDMARFRIGRTEHNHPGSR